MLKEKILRLANKIKIFLEVNFYLVLHFQEIKQVPFYKSNKPKWSSLADSNSDSESTKIS